MENSYHRLKKHLQETEKLSISLSKRIASGGFGSIHKATDNFGNTYAIKFLRKRKNGFLNNNNIIEFDIMSRIDHPYLNSALKIWSDDKGIYIFQELADSDLAKWRDYNRLKEKQIKRWFLMTCFAIKHLHDQDIIHGDIKANNILLFDGDKENSRVKLCDYSLTFKLRYQNYSNNSRTNLCTCTHRSPENWAGLKNDKSVDIWALGVTLCEIAYNQYLFPYDQDNSENSEYSMSQIRKWAKSVNKEIPSFLKSSSSDTKSSTISLNPSFNIDRLILLMCEPDPLKRPTIDQIIADKYFDSIRGDIESNIESSISPTISPMTMRKKAFIASLTPKGIDESISAFVYEICERASPKSNLRPTLLKEISLLTISNLLNYEIPKEYVFESEKNELINNEISLFDLLNYKFF